MIAVRCLPEGRGTVAVRKARVSVMVHNMYISDVLFEKNQLSVAIGVMINGKDADVAPARGQARRQGAQQLTHSIADSRHSKRLPARAASLFGEEV